MVMKWLELKLKFQLSYQWKNVNCILNFLNYLRKKNHHLIYLNVSLKNNIIDLDFCKNLDLFLFFE